LPKLAEGGKTMALSGACGRNPTRAEEVAAAVDVSGVNTFQAQRRLIRVALDGAGIAGEIDALVLALVEPVAVESTAAS
jgi:hypothetical protein